jgi:hypothetical protein
VEEALDTVFPRRGQGVFLDSVGSLAQTTTIIISDRETTRRAVVDSA